MSEDEEGAPDTAGGPGGGGTATGGGPGHDTAAPARTQPSLTSQVRRRRADQAFFLRLRDAIAQNHRALERLGT
jgi:hypothetical protein